MSLAIPITGTFDIAVARNKVRKVAEEYNWPPTFRARASAALTVMVELALFAQYPMTSTLLLNVTLICKGTRIGVEFDCETSLLTNGPCESSNNPATAHLKRACDELIIEERNGVEHIIVRIWSK